MPTYTDEEKLACAERESAMRRKAYPKWVAAGKMTNEKAGYEMAVMDAIAEDYREAIRGSR